MIDRFDVRAHLDEIQEQPSNSDSEEEKEEDNSALCWEDRQLNYERFRILVQNNFLGSKCWAILFR